MRSFSRILVLVALLSIGTGLVACAGPLTEKDNGRSIECALDSELEIVLDGNVTTGYSWELVEYNEAVVRPVGKPEYTSETSSKRLGAGGIFTFKFKIVAAGDSLVKIVYRRPWEKDHPPSRTFVLQIMAGTMGVIESD